MRAPSLRDRIRNVLNDGRWHTGLEIARTVRGPNAQYGPGIAAKIRDLRKLEYGGHKILSEKDPELSRTTGSQVWRFKMVLGETQLEADGITFDQEGQGLLMSGALEGPDFYKREGGAA